MSEEMLSSNILEKCSRTRFNPEVTRLKDLHSTLILLKCIAIPISDCEVVVGFRHRWSKQRGLFYDRDFDLAVPNKRKNDVLFFP